MNYLKQQYSSIKKKALQYINPNENPTDKDKYAFNLLDKAQVSPFIEFIQKQKQINVNAIYGKSSLIIKAANIPTYANDFTKKLTEQELQDRAIQALNFLLKKGVDVNFQNSNGITALLSACHWGYYRIAQVLLKNGANPNLGSKMQGFCTNPLLSSSFKNNKEIVDLLISFGADPEITEEYNRQTYGFKLTKEQLQYLYSAHNIMKLVYRRQIGRKNKKYHSILSGISDNVFNGVCLNV